MNMKGFTLIELVVVFALIGVLTSIGVTSYTVYNSTQTIQIATGDVLNLLSTAKSRALSQVKPPQCAGKTLSGYQITITAPGSSYAMTVQCGGNSYLIESRQLPPNITFVGGSTASIIFGVSSGTSANPAIINMTGYGKTKTISVQTTGNIISN